MLNAVQLFLFRRGFASYGYAAFLQEAPVYCEVCGTHTGALDEEAYVFDFDSAPVYFCPTCDCGRVCHFAEEVVLDLDLGDYVPVGSTDLGGYVF